MLAAYAAYLEVTSAPSRTMIADRYTQVKKARMVLTEP